MLVDVASPEQLGNAMRVMGPSFLDEMIQEAGAAIKLAIGPTRTAYHVAPNQFAFLSPPDVEEQSYVALLASTMAGFRASASSRFVTTLTIGVAPFVVGLASPRDVLRIASSAVQDAYGTESKVSVYSSAQMPRAQSSGERLAVPAQQLAVEPRVRLLRRPRRPLL